MERRERGGEERKMRGKMEGGGVEMWGGGGEVMWGMGRRDREIHIWEGDGKMGRRRRQGGGGGGGGEGGGEDSLKCFHIKQLVPSHQLNKRLKLPPTTENCMATFYLEM